MCDTVEGVSRDMRKTELYRRIGARKHGATSGNALPGQSARGSVRDGVPARFSVRGESSAAPAPRRGRLLRSESRFPGARGVVFVSIPCLIRRI